MTLIFWVFLLFTPLVSSNLSFYLLPLTRITYLSKEKLQILIFSIPLPLAVNSNPIYIYIDLSYCYISDNTGIFWTRNMFYSEFYFYVVFARILQKCTCNRDIYVLRSYKKCDLSLSYVDA
jgi:hypothetical protein